MKKVHAIAIVCGIALVAVVVTFFVLTRHKEPGSSSSGQPEVKVRKIRLALDSVSSNCIFRAPEFKQRLEKNGVDFEWVDDKADYAKRISTIESSETPLAVFPIDGLMANTPAAGVPHAAIIMLVNEARGSDALIGYKSGLKDVNALNIPTAKVVSSPGSPGETLFRVVRDRFDLSQQPKERKDCLISANDKGAPLAAKEVYVEFLNAEPTERKAYILREPYLSLALQEKPNAHVLVDSSEFTGYLVGALVVQPNFLQKNRALVESFAKTYLELLHEKQSSADGMAELVLADARIIEEDKINSLEIAKKVADGIWWKNAAENYAHFDLESGKGMQSVSGMVQRITSLLNRTRAEKDEIVGVKQLDKLINGEILNKLHDQQFNVDEKVSSPGALPDIDDWATLEKVGNFKIKSISFSSKLPDELSNDAKEMLRDWADGMRPWPSYYLLIEGSTNNAGDSEANRDLSEKRANSVRNYLLDDLEANRLMAQAMELGQGKEVRIVALRRPRGP